MDVHVAQPCGTQDIKNLEAHGIKLLTSDLDITNMVKVAVEHQHPIFEHRALPALNRHYKKVKQTN